MSNYRFIMRTEGSDEYAKDFVDYHKGTKSEQSRMEEASDYNG